MPPSPWSRCSGIERDFMDYGKLYSDDVWAFVPSPVRAIFKNYDFSKIISFAGGYPSSDTFRTDDIILAAEEAFRLYGPGILQYGATEGLMLLREAISERYGVPVNNVGITTSSQQGIDLCARIFVNPADAVFVNRPTFLGAIQSFRSYRADIRGVKASPDASGAEGAEAVAGAYSAAIAAARSEGLVPKFIYLIPDFNNPTGETLSLEAREAVIDVARRESLMIVEDSPYRELRFSGSDVPSMYSLAPDCVLHLGSFSKILAPGFRLGWVFGPREVLDRLTACKQSADLCPPMLDQHIAAILLNSGRLQDNLRWTVSLDRRKRDFMLAMLERHMPSGVNWTRPEGGLFVFLTLPEHIDTVALYDSALSAGVAYVSGAFFHPDGGGRNTMRLNYSFMDMDRIEEGISVLAGIIRAHINAAR